MGRRLHKTLWMLWQIRREPAARTILDAALLLAEALSAQVDQRSINADCPPHSTAHEAHEVAVCEV